MLVFVTGAGGFIGRAAVTELINHGHQVLGLARSDASAEILTNLGAQVHRGDLEDLDSLSSGAKAADGVIHLAFLHDFANYARCAEVDQAAIQIMADAIEGTGKPLVIASGTMMAKKGVLAYEGDEPEGNMPFALREASAKLVAKLAKDKGFRGSTVRLPPTVHGKDDKGLIPRFGGMGQKAGHVTIIGDGANRWPACHRLDAAAIFRLAMEKGTPGAVYHAVAEQGVPMKDIMDIVGKKLQLPVKSLTIEEAMPSMGVMAIAIGADNPTSSERTQKELGWDPKASGEPELLADLEANYFK